MTLDSWQISTQHSASSRSPWRCSDSFGRWTGYESPRPSSSSSRSWCSSTRLRDVQAGVVLDGLLLTIVTLGDRARLAWRYLGSYMAAVFDGRVHFLGFVERPIYRVLGTSPSRSRPGSATPARSSSSPRSRSASRTSSCGSRARCRSILSTSAPSPPALSFNTAASFVTNTNWQNYGGEETMSYFSQIGALTFQQFVSPGGRHRRRDRDGARLLPAKLGDDRQLLGRHRPGASSTSCCRSPSSPASSSSDKVRSRPSPGRSASTTR